MKKIIGAAALAVAAAGLATADVGVNLNYRRATNVFENKDVSRDAVTFGKFGDITGTDAFTFKAANEYAGITLNYNPNSAVKANDSLTVSGKIDSKDATMSGGTGGFWLNGTGVEYTAFVNPTPWLQIKSGAFKDGIMYAEQAKKDTDDTQWSAAGKYGFLYKLGIATKNSTGFTMDDMTSVNNSATPFLFTDFKFDNVGPGNLLVRASFAQAPHSDGWLLAGGFHKKSMLVAPGMVIGYNAKNLVNVNLDVQMASNNDLAVGLYVSPLMVQNLQLTVGGTVSTVLDGEKAAYGARLKKTISSGNKEIKTNTKKTDVPTTTNEWESITFYGIDLRARYVAGAFHIANAFNFTGASEDKAVKQGGSTGSTQTGNYNIWDALFLTYALNDKWTLTGNVQLQAALDVDVTKDGKTKEETILDLAVTPGVMYTVGKGATITAGLYMSFADLTDKTESGNTTGIALPVIFRVKM